MKSWAQQRGAVLVVALIMLALVTLMGAVSASLVQTNLKVMQNIEARSAARSAALRAIQEAFATEESLASNNDLGFLAGDLAFTTSCNNSHYSRCLSLTGAADENDIIVSLTKPTCISAVPVTNLELDKSNFAEASCNKPGSLSSYCADAVWEVVAVAIDQVTGANVEVRQGIRTRTTTNLLATACNT